GAEDRVDRRHGARVDRLDRVAHEPDEVREVVVTGQRVALAARRALRGQVRRLVRRHFRRRNYRERLDVGPGTTSWDAARETSATRSRTLHRRVFMRRVFLTLAGDLLDATHSLSRTGASSRHPVPYIS